MEVAAKLSLRFPGGKWVAWKKVKTFHISGTIPPIFLNLSGSRYVWNNNGLNNNNYWDDLESINESQSVKFHSFPYISATLGPILTKFRPQWWNRGQQQKLHCWPWKIKVNSSFTKIIISHMTDFNQTFTKIMQLLMATTVSHQLTLKM